MAESMAADWATTMIILFVDLAIYGSGCGSAQLAWLFYFAAGCVANC